MKFQGCDIKFAVPGVTFSFTLNLSCGGKFFFHLNIRFWEREINHREIQESFAEDTKMEPLLFTVVLSCLPGGYLFLIVVKCVHTKCLKPGERTLLQCWYQTQAALLPYVLIDLVTHHFLTTPRFVRHL